MIWAPLAFAVLTVGVMVSITDASRSLITTMSLSLRLKLRSSLDLPKYVLIFIISETAGSEATLPMVIMELPLEKTKATSNFSEAGTPLP
ncbi:MAG: hypothetical protein C5S40_00210 [ANME-2 cluster archaeon]|nr:hypothetical protein [ANME-2 cluster archaeon]